MHNCCSLLGSNGLYSDNFVRLSHPMFTCQYVVVNDSSLSTYTCYFSANIFGSTVYRISSIYTALKFLYIREGRRRQFERFPNKFISAQSGLKRKSYPDTHILLLLFWVIQSPFRKRCSERSMEVLHSVL